MENELRMIMARRKISIGEMAEMAGLTRNAISNIYHEKTNPTVDSLIKIAKALNVTLNDIVPIEQKTN